MGYPLFLNLEGERCLVFGGGKVATRKIQALLKKGAQVTCVSREFTRAMKNLAKKFRSHLVLTRVGAGFKPTPTSINSARVVIAATSDRNFNARVARICRKKKILVNVVDDPELCDFTVPAVLERGPLQIAISTGGSSPLFARRLREELEKAIPQSTGRLLERIGSLRGPATRLGGSAAPFGGRQ